MVILKLKNKYATTFTKLIQSAELSGGIFDFIEVSAKEAKDILLEIREVGDDSFLFEVKKGADPRFRLNGKIDLSVIKELILEWWHGDFSVYFRHKKDHIPIILKLETKKLKK